MEKREALAIVIQSLEIIPDDLKEKLIEAIPAMPDEAIDSLGKQLGELKAASLLQTQTLYEKVKELSNMLQFPEN